MKKVPAQLPEIIFTDEPLDHWKFESQRLRETFAQVVAIDIESGSCIG